MQSELENERTKMQDKNMTYSRREVVKESKRE